MLSRDKGWSSARKTIAPVSLCGNVPEKSARGKRWCVRVSVSTSTHMPPPHWHRLGNSHIIYQELAPVLHFSIWWCVLLPPESPLRCWPQLDMYSSAGWAEALELVLAFCWHKATCSAPCFSCWNCVLSQQGLDSTWEAACFNCTLRSGPFTCVYLCVCTLSNGGGMEMVLWVMSITLLGCSAAVLWTSVSSLLQTRLIP